MPFIIVGAIGTIGWLVLALVCFVAAADIAPDYPGGEAAPLPRLFYELRSAQAFDTQMLGFGCVGLAILTALVVYGIILLRAQRGDRSPAGVAAPLPPGR